MLIVLKFILYFVNVFFVNVGVYCGYFFLSYESVVRNRARFLFVFNFSVVVNCVSVVFMFFRFCSVFFMLCVFVVFVIVLFVVCVMCCENCCNCCCSMLYLFVMCVL